VFDKDKSRKDSDIHKPFDLRDEKRRGNKFFKNEFKKIGYE